MTKNGESLGSIPSWTGLSTEDKPRTAAQGSNLLCVDTMEKWIFNDGMWVFDVTSQTFINGIYLD